MLRLNEDGSISLTISGVVVSTISAYSVETIKAKELVAWENQARLYYYEKNNGFWSHKNQREAREAETSVERLKVFPKATIQTLDAHNEYWERKRLEAIDN